MKLYVCGPMTGYPELNFPLFQKTTSALRDAGHEVVCPTEISVECGCAPGAHTWHEYLARDIKAICDVDALFLLDGWDKSRGAVFEVFVAQKLGKGFFNGFYDEVHRIYELEPHLIEDALVEPDILKVLMK